MTAVVGEEFRDSQLRSTGPRLRVERGEESQGGGNISNLSSITRPKSAESKCSHQQGSKPFVILDLSSGFTRSTKPVLTLLQVVTGTGEDG